MFFSLIKHSSGPLSVASCRSVDSLIITQSRYAKYEEETFKTQIDLLVVIDLQQFRIEELLKLSNGTTVCFQTVHLDRT